MEIKLLILSISLLVAADSFAQNFTMELGQPTLSGTGCSDTEDMVILSPDKSVISILFNSYSVKAGGVTHQTYADKKNCNIAIPITVSKNYSIAIIQFDYRGFNSLPSGAQSVFSAKYFYTGQNPVNRAKVFSGGLESDFLLTDFLVGQEFVWSPCNKDTTLNIQSSLSVRSNYGYQETLASLDSADADASIAYRLIYRKCQ